MKLKLFLKVASALAEQLSRPAGVQINNLISADPFAAVVIVTNCNCQDGLYWANVRFMLDLHTTV